MANPVDSDEVDTGRKDEPFVRCDGSRWVATTRTTGEGVGTLVQFEPTGAARAWAINAYTSLGKIVAEWARNPVYLQMWSDLEGCAHFSDGIPPEQLHSMYKQMACHARWGATGSPYMGGNTWDLEAWHVNVDWGTALAPWKKCGNGYGDLPTETTGAFLVGRIVNGRAYAQPRPGEEIKAWLVYGGAPKPYRRHIATAKAYHCLVAAGRSKASWFPWTFLNQYVDKVPGDITDAEACGPSSHPPPGSQPAPTLPSPSISPTPAPSTPASLKISGKTTSTISLSWSASSDDVGVAGYSVYRNGTRIANTGSTSYRVSGLSCGTSYKLGVDAYDDAGNRSPAASLTASTSACPKAVKVSKGASINVAGCKSSACAYVQVSLSGFGAGSHAVTCYADYPPPTGSFYQYTTSATTSNVCVYGYPGTHVWVEVDGVESNHLTW